MQFSTLSCINQTDLERLRMLLSAEQFNVFEINGTGVRDATSFFRLISCILPLDPPLSGNVNWNALSDSLWEGVDALGSPRNAIVWTDAQDMLVGGLFDLLMAIDCLLEVARSLRDPRTGVSSPKELLVFLVGNGPNFSSLETRN